MSSEGKQANFKLGDVTGLAGGDVVDLEAVPSKPQEAEGFGGDYIKAFVFGGLDGIVSTFALVAGLGGAQVDIGTLIAVSLAKVLADAFSMGFGEFTSAMAELEHSQKLRNDELRACSMDSHGQAKELLDCYLERGCDKRDALTLVSLLARYKEVFLNHGLALKQGVIAEEDDDIWQPLKQGFVCFLAFALFGLVPLFGFMIFYAVDGGKSNEYWVILVIAYCLTATTLFIMGVTKAKLTGAAQTVQVVRSGSMMLLNGTVAGAAAYLIGETLAAALGSI